MNLSKRLEAVVQFIPANSRIADIGTDHGYVPTTLIQRNIATWAVAADMNHGPLQSAMSTIRDAGLDKQVACREGNGLAVLTPGEVDGVLVCGMGGALIRDILASQPAVTAQLQFLVLQPMTGAAVLRRYLAATGWRIADEALVIEEPRLYEIIYAIPHVPYALEEWEYEVGPVNWQKQSIALDRHIRQCIEKKDHILEGLRKGGETNSERYDTVRRGKIILEEKLCRCY